MYRQTTALECLELERSKWISKIEAAEFGQQNQQQQNQQQQQQHRQQLSDTANRHDSGMIDCNVACPTKDNDSDAPGSKDEPSKKMRDPRTSFDRVEARRLELQERTKKLEELRCDLVNVGNTNDGNHSLSLAGAESRFRTIVGSPRKACPILDRPKETWKIISEQRSRGDEFGRPRGFTGLVFYSPLGVPILVGKPKAESDEALRRASQGSDLWFQVEDYEGSRVLLRSSQVKGTKNSKKCVQMAADLAARYSIWGRTSPDARGEPATTTVPVMYTDSKHVAKRGTKVGRMRKKKSLGTMAGRPSNVEDLTRGLEPA